MFGWLRRLWRRLFHSDGGPYADSERLIFKFFNGEKVVKADPMVLYRAVMSDGPNLSITMKVADMTPPPGVPEHIAKKVNADAAEAYADMAKKIRGIFKLKEPVDGLDVTGTLTDAEALDLLSYFMSWCDDCRKKAKRPQTTWKPSAVSQPITDDAPASENTSGSGSIASEPSTDVPTPPLWESASPSEPSHQETTTAVQ